VACGALLLCLSRHAGAVYGTGVSACLRPLLPPLTCRPARSAPVRPATLIQLPPMCMTLAYAILFSKLQGICAVVAVFQLIFLSFHPYPSMPCQLSRVCSSASRRAYAPWLRCSSSSFCPVIFPFNAQPIEAVFAPLHPQGVCAVVAVFQLIFLSFHLSCPAQPIEAVFAPLHPAGRMCGSCSVPAHLPVLLEAGLADGMSWRVAASHALRMCCAAAHCGLQYRASHVRIPFTLGSTATFCEG